MATSHILALPEARLIFWMEQTDVIDSLMAHDSNIILFAIGVLITLLVNTGHMNIFNEM